MACFLLIDSNICSDFVIDFRDSLKAGIDEFTLNKILDQDTLRLAKKVKVRVDPGIDKLVPEKRGAKVRVLIKGGTNYEQTVENPRGEPENLVSENEVIDKFKMLTHNTLEKEKMDAVIETVDKLDQLDGIRDLVILLT